MKRGFLSDFVELSADDIGFVKKRHCSTEGPSAFGTTTFGPIPITTFNPQLFPPNAMVYVTLPESSVYEPYALPLTSSILPGELLCNEPFSNEPLLCNEPFVADTLASNIPLPFAEESGHTEQAGPSKTVSAPREKNKIKLTTLEILELKHVFFYNATTARLPSGILLESIPDKKNKKRRISSELLQNPLCWNGIAVATFLKNDKSNIAERYIFTDELFHLSQYVMPMGFAQDRLVLPSNAICYTSYNKGNHQVTFILTDMFVFNDVKKAVKKHRFSYGMTVLKKFHEPKEVQYCFMVLMALAFHLFRKWCSKNNCTKHLLDASFQEPTFDDLCNSILKDSQKHLSTGLTLEDMEFLLERSDTLFKKLVQLCVSLYKNATQ